MEKNCVRKNKLFLENRKLKKKSKLLRCTTHRIDNGLTKQQQQTYILHNIKNTKLNSSP